MDSSGISVLIESKKLSEDKKTNIELKVGDQAPSFELKDQDNQIYLNAELIDNGGMYDKEELKQYITVVFHIYRQN